MFAPIRNLIVSGVRVALACLLLFSATPLIAENPSESFYGEIPRFDPGRLERIRVLLDRLAIECPEAEQKCPVSRELLREISGDLNSDEFPFLIVYLDENLSVRVNRIIWKGDVTPFIYGVQSVWAFLFLEKPVSLEARLTTLWIEEEAVTQGLRNLFISPGRRLAEEREARAIARPIMLTPLTGDDESRDDLWIGAERFYVEEDAAYEITISPADDAARKELDFLRIYSRFTNSEQKSVDFGLGIGYTFNVREEILDDLDGIRTDNGVISGSWLFSIYLRRPILVEPIQSRIGSRYRVSYAITLGANFNLFDLDQFIVGLNIGHLFGRHGLLIGVSYIDPLDSARDENDTAPYFAYVYNF